MKKLNTYKIIKIDSSKIKNRFSTDKGEYNIKLSYKEAVKNSFIVSISESQLTRHLESMNRIKIIPSVNVKGKPILDHKGKQKHIKFIPDIIFIRFDDTTVFTQMRDRCLRTKKEPYAFIYNGDTYSRLFTPSSNGRKSTSIYVNDNIKKELLNKCENGLDLSDMVLNSFKFNAYIGLCVSSSHEVSLPRVCVINDFKLPISINAIFIEETKTEDKNNYSDNFIVDSGKNGNGIIRENIKNCFDGMGLIDPTFAEVWAKDLECDYVPCGWIIRNAFLKGAVFNFDFKLWAKKMKEPIDFITDIFGKKHLIDEIDIILTASQFKMWKQYHILNNEKEDTWDFYQKCCLENDNTWGVTKTSPKNEIELGNTNYQFLQTLDLKKDDILNLCKDSKTYLDKYINNPEAALEIVSYQSDGNVSACAQALELYHGAINDPYIANKINNAIEDQIKDMCLGRLKVDGNYQFMISDPVAFCEWAFYRNPAKVKGLLKENQYYSKYWLDKGINKVSAIRAPNIHFSEHNILNLIDNEEIQLWYKHLPSGIIYNIFGDDFIKHSGSDVDGDLVFCSSSNELLSGTVSQPVIDFKHPETKEKPLTEKYLFEADKEGFKVNIGHTVNLATVCVNLMAKYKKDSKEYIELDRRAKILTAIGQLTIDAQKGCEVMEVPEHWYKFQPILTEEYYRNKYNRKSKELFKITLEELEQKTNLTEDERILLEQYNENRKILDTDEIARKKEFNNSILLNKKPYFFIYKEKDLMKEYKRYLNILSLRNSERAENPINDCDSLMNIVCKEVEKYNYNNKLTLNSKCKNIDKTWISLMKDKSKTHNAERYKSVVNLHKDYKNAKKQAHNINCYGDAEDKIISHNAVDECYKILFLEKVENESELANFLIKLLYEKKPSASKADLCKFAALWKLAGNGVIENIKKNLENVKCGKAEKI